MTFRFTLAGQPVAKGRVRFARATGHAFTPEKTVAYESMLSLAGQEAMKGAPPFNGPLEVRVWAELQIPASWSLKKKRLASSGRLLPIGRPDLDNYAKILDALNLIVWTDDSQIVDLRVTKIYSTQPQMTIEVEQLDDFMA